MEGKIAGWIREYVKCYPAIKETTARWEEPLIAYADAEDPERCVNDALFTDSYDRWKCYEMCLHNDSIYPDIGVADVCGKCLVAVPCASSDPVKKLQNRE